MPPRREKTEPKQLPTISKEKRRGSRQQERRELLESIAETSRPSRAGSSLVAPQQIFTNHRKHGGGGSFSTEMDPNAPMEPSAEMEATLQKNEAKLDSMEKSLDELCTTISARIRRKSKKKGKDVSAKSSKGGDNGQRKY